MEIEDKIIDYIERNPGVKTSEIIDLFSDEYTIDEIVHTLCHLEETKKIYSGENK